MSSPLFNYIENREEKNEPLLSYNAKINPPNFQLGDCGRVDSTVSHQSSFAKFRRCIYAFQSYIFLSLASTTYIFFVLGSCSLDPSKCSGHRSRSINHKSGSISQDEALHPETQGQFDIFANLLVKNGISFRNAFHDDSSPQYKSLKWIIATGTDDQYDQDISKDEWLHYRFVQRYVVGTLFFSVSGDGWDSCVDDTPCTEWLGVPKDDQVMSDECTWVGLTCDQKGRLTKIVQSPLAHREHKITGRLADEIKYLSTLKTLYLPNNKLEGTIPETFHSSRLEIINLANNKLSGTISEAFFDNLKRIRVINLSQNENIAGTISTKLGNLLTLEHLSLGYMSFGGTITTELAKLGSLRAFNVTGNKLIGTIPEEFYSSLSNLRHVDLSRNALTGTISDQIGKLRNLKEFIVDQNYLVGELPSTFASLSALEVLGLSNNYFTGVIPKELENMKSLRHAYFGNNRLVNAPPNQLLRLEGLRTLQFYQNSINGTVDCFLKRDSLTVLEADCAGDDSVVSCNCCTQCYFPFKVKPTHTSLSVS